MKARFGLLLAAAATFMISGSQAEAGGFALREQSAEGLGRAFSGVAAGGALSAMFWNPATLDSVRVLELEATGSLIFPTSDVEVDAPAASSEGDIGKDAFLPAGYGGYRFNDKLVLGVGVNGPYGLSTKYDGGSPVRAAGVAGTSKVFTINVNPAVAYQINDWLTLAVGMQIQYAKVRLTGLGPFELEGDDIAPGITAGVLVRPRPGTEIGLGYRSRLSHEFDADLTGPGGPFSPSAEGFDLPDVVSLGLRQSIREDIRVSAGIEYANWGRFDTVDLSAGPIPELGFDYDDGWFFSIGGEYDWSDRLTLRAGVGYELSPIDDDNRSFRLPDNDRLWLSAGATYRPSDQLSVDLAYAFLTSGDSDLIAAADGGPASNGPFSGTSEGHVHLLSAGLRYQFAPEAAPAFESEPTVVK